MVVSTPPSENDLQLWGRNVSENDLQPFHAGTEKCVEKDVGYK